MTICPKCQQVSLRSFTCAEDTLLHENWSALEKAAGEQNCGLCRLFLDRLTERLCKELPRFVIDTETLKAWDLDASGHLGSLPDHWYHGCGTRILVHGNHTTGDRPTLTIECQGYEEWTFGVMSMGPDNTIKSNLYYKQPGNGLFYKFETTVTLPAFCIEGDPLLRSLQVPVKRALSADDTDKMKLQRAAEWIRECRSSHAECKGPIGASQIPRRLLHLEQRYGEIYATVVKIENIPLGGYVTLSYCWGPVRPQWIDQVKRIHHDGTGFSIGVMPATLRDAASMCMSLGFEYLWIDALCILQDSLDDWLTESEKMGDVFANSVLTISATDVACCYDGLLGRQRTAWSSYVQVGLQTREGFGHLWVGERASHFPGQMTQNSFVLNRGWCLQERHFSRRILHYCREEAYLECCRGCRYESDVHRQADYDKGLSKDELDQVSMQELDEYRNSDGLHRKPAVDLWTNRMWYETVKQYSDMRLTQGGDKLVAIAGLAKRAHQHVQSQYLAGIWLSHLAFGLCWDTNPADKTGLSPKRATPYRAPSWSWASIDGAIEACRGTVYIDNSQSNITLFDAFIPMVEVLDAVIKTRNDQPFGQVLAGELRLKGKLKGLDMSRLIRKGGRDNGPRAWEPYPDRTQRHGYYVEDTHEALSGEYTCLPVAMQQVLAPSPSRLYLLVLESTQSEASDTYKRVGFASIWDLQYFDDVPAEEFRLV